MQLDDPHKYDNDLPAVRLEFGPAGARVTTARSIPCHRTIRHVIAGALVTVFSLDANYSTEGGLEGVMEHDDIDEALYVEMRWTDGDSDVWLMSEHFTEPYPGEEVLGSYFYNVLEIAMLQLARDGEGYPLILSSRDELLVTHVLLEALRRQFGGVAHDAIAAFLRSTAGSNIALAGLG